MDTLPQTNISPVTPEKSKSPGIILGIVTGIVQLVVMFFGTNSFGGVFNVFVNGLSILYLYIPFLLLPLIIEFILLRKTHGRFIKGVLIGTILVPLIGLGVCFALLASWGG